MGYGFLALALLAGAAKGFCGKKTSGIITGLRDSVLANMLRMLLCVLLGLVIALIGSTPEALLPNKELLGAAALSGISTAAFVVAWLCAVRKSAYMLVDVFLMLGVLIPLLLGNAFFQEAIAPKQWIGISILLVAVLLLCSYNNRIKARLTPASLALLVLCGVANGVTDFSQKLFTRLLPQTPASVFNLYTYLFALISLAVCFTFFKPDSHASHPRRFLKLFGYILIMAVCLFANSLFKTMAAVHLDSVLLYPLNQGMAMILSTIMSAFFFRERITLTCAFGLLTAFAGLLVINVL